MSNELMSDDETRVTSGRIHAEFLKLDTEAKAELALAVLMDTCRSIGKALFEKIALSPELFEPDEKDLQE